MPHLPSSQVRRAADPAKNLVREFLGRWKDSPAVAGEESYAQLTSAIQQLGTFYQVRAAGGVGGTAAVAGRIRRCCCRAEQQRSLCSVLTALCLVWRHWHSS